MVRTCLVAALLANVAGCSTVIDQVTSGFDTNDFSGDPFPIVVDDTSGAIVVGLQEAGVDAKRSAVLDVLSPVTLIDRGSDVQVSIETTDLTVLGMRASTGELDLPRARFSGKQVVTLHPCGTPECEVGTVTTPRPFDALIGLDSFAGDGLRLRLADDEIFILPDVAGSDIHRARSCDAVLDSPFRGGGTLVLGGTEVPFTNWRIAIDACIAPNPARLITQSERGVDVLLVASTAVGTSLLSTTAYNRYRELDPSAPVLETLPSAIVMLPSGAVSGYLTDIPSIALVGNSASNPRAPCRQMWASHLLAARDCELGDDCPCDSGTFCGVPAIVELAPPARIQILVVSDDEPTLQALRTELRPDRPEVDGILGADALRTLELDIDYQHDRLLGRCVDRRFCGARAALDNQLSRDYVNGCLDEQPGPIVLIDN
jgi:hypothetical protein